jgi:hypothetical protein
VDYNYLDLGKQNLLLPMVVINLEHLLQMVVEFFLDFVQELEPREICIL